MKVTLTVIAGPQKDRRFEFAGYDTFTVGRSEKATFAIEGDAAFSRMHFLVEVNPPLCFLKNLSLTGGTYVNGQRVTQVALRNGDVISGGKETMILVALESAVPRARRDDPSGATTFAERPHRVQKPAVEPAQIAGYKFERELGAGGRGRVFLASRTKDGMSVAVKTMAPSGIIDGKATASFLREIEVLRKLKHPHIVELLDAGQISGDASRGLFFVMEYIAGCDVESLTETSQGRIDICLAVRLFEQALEGLNYAHSLGFVHRDIKGRNMMVAGQPGNEILKLTDFGLARKFEQAGLSGLTRTGDTLGTLAFMAPEQLLNARLADPCSDLYSVGASLYRLLTGRYLWNPQSDFSDPLLQILYEEPIPIQQHREDVPDGLAWVIHKALSREPRDRFADAETMRQALHAQLG